MSVSFNQIPAALRTPLFYIEIDNSAAGSPAAGANPTLIVGSLLAAGSLGELIMTPVNSFSQAKSLFGEGSVIADMVGAFKDNNPFGELWCIGLADTGGTAAVKTITVTGTATAAGTVSLYFHGRLIEVAVASGDAFGVVAAAIDTALTAASDIMYTNGVAAGLVTLTARNLGETGSAIDVQVNYLGLAAGESLPAGITIVIAETIAGAANPDMGQIAAVVGEKKFDYVLHPYTDTANLNDVESLMDEVTGRWAWNRKIYGHAYTGLRGTQGALTTAGNLRNDQHHTIVAVETTTPSSPWAVASAVVGKSATALDIDPARPLQTLELASGDVDILPPPDGAELTQIERNILLFDGITTLFVGPSGYQIERLITTYQLDSFSNADDSYLDVNTLYTAMRVQRRLETLITGKFPRHKLADDGTAFGAGQAIVTPSIIRGELIAEYSAMEALGWVENATLFAANLIVERSTTDPNRVDVLFPPDFINQLRVLAVLNQFRLQYPATAA